MVSTFGVGYSLNPIPSSFHYMFESKIEIIHISRDAWTDNESVGTGELF